MSGSTLLVHQAHCAPLERQKVVGFEVYKHLATLDELFGCGCIRTKTTPQFRARSIRPTQPRH